eukprot:UC1_evm6s1820
MNVSKCAYRTISGKLRKRFMRRVNTADAEEQYRSLASKLQQDGCRDFAGFCCLAAARCSQAAGNSTAEAEHLVQGAQLFVQAETDDRGIDSLGFEDNLFDAVQCYEQAVEIYLGVGRPSYAATLYVELASVLRVFGHIEQAADYFGRAATLLKDSPIPAISAMSDAVTCHSGLGEYAAALRGLLKITTIVERVLDTRHKSGGEGSKTDDGRSATTSASSASGVGSISTNDDGSGGSAAAPTGDGVNSGTADIDDVFLRLARRCPPGAYRDILAAAETSSVLLWLLLPEQDKKAEFAQVRLLVDRYLVPWVRGSSTAPHLTQRMAQCLQSVVMASEVRDIDALQALQAELWFMLTPTQNSMLRAITQKLSR